MEDGIAVSRLAVAYARERFGLPVILMGSSMGGLLTVFSLLAGVAPDLAVAHNFVYPSGRRGADNHALVGPARSFGLTDLIK